MAFSFPTNSLPQRGSSHGKGQRLIVTAPTGHQTKFTPPSEFTSAVNRESNTIMHTEYKVPYSRLLAEKGMRRDSRTESTIDTKHVQLYLRRQGSRSSVFSSASAGLANGDNGSLVSASRPVSAESNIIQKPIIPSSSSQVNTRVVLPNPASRMFSSLSGGNNSVINRSASIPNLRRRSSYLDKSVYQILDYLFVGGIEAAYNANLLCRLNIEYIIDISNVEPMKVPRNKRSDCPCLCPLETAHSRARMTIMIDENSQLDLVTYFDDINQFIESARIGGKNVLVHSYNGRNRSAVLVVQYLMKTMNFSLEKAIEFVKARKAEVMIKENFHKSLRKWDIIIQQKPRNHVPKIGGYSGYRTPSATKSDKFTVTSDHVNNGDSKSTNAKRAAWM